MTNDLQRIGEVVELIPDRPYTDGGEPNWYVSREKSGWLFWSDSFEKAEVLRKAVEIPKTPVVGKLHIRPVYLGPPE